MALSEADFWIVEDTRISAKLAFHLGVKKTMRVAHDHSEDFQLEKLLEEIESGKQAVLLTDGGAPGISDPGARLTDLAHNRGIEVDGIPGPSAVINALMLSGFFAQRFAFLGFLGRTPGDMKKELDARRRAHFACRRSGAAARRAVGREVQQPRDRRSDLSRRDKAAGAVARADQTPNKSSPETFGGVTPRCRYAANVAMRPRGVRCR